MFARLARLVVGHPWSVIGVWIVAAVAIVALSPGLPTTTDESDFLPRHYESIQAMELQESAFPAEFDPTVTVVAARKDGKPLTGKDALVLCRVAAAAVKSGSGQPEQNQLAGACGLTAAAAAAEGAGAAPVAGPERRRLLRVAATAKPLNLDAANVALGTDAIQQALLGEPSPNGMIQTIGLQTPALTHNNQEQLFDLVGDLRHQLKPIAEANDLKLLTAGQVAAGYDQMEAFETGDMLVAVGTVLIIILLLLAIFRSPIVAFLPIIVIGIVAAVANGLIADVVRAFGLQTDSSITSLLTVVLFGIGTDYILFLLFRYRERLRLGEDGQEAMIQAITRVGEVIASAAGVVIIAFLALTLSSLTFMKSMGPSLAIAVAVTLLAGLTLVPAVVSLLGPKVFWPSKSWQREPKAARFAAIGKSMGRHPGRYALVSGVVMLGLAAGALGFNPSFDLASGSIPSTAESQRADRLFQERGGLPPGLLSPTSVYLKADSGQLDREQLDTFRGQLLAAVGTDALRVAGIDPLELAKAVPADVMKDLAGSGADLSALSGGLPPAAVTSMCKAVQAPGAGGTGGAADGAAGADPARMLGSLCGMVFEPVLDPDRTTASFTVILPENAESDGAMDLVKGPLRDIAHNDAPAGTSALVGGITSIYADIESAMNRDYSIVFPVAAILIMLVLGLLLRSLVAPIYMMVAVGLGFLATLGATTLIFQEARGEVGLIFMLPLIMYMFVVALGTDYNILMTARLREEASAGHDPRKALAEGIRHTGPTVAAAGVILAGSFATLLLAGNTMLSQMGFAIAFGIVVAAFVMAMFFTPSITALLGRKAWWPGHRDE